MRRRARVVDVPDVVVPDDVRFGPKTGPVSERIAWRERRKAWCRVHGLVDGRGEVDWRRFGPLLRQRSGYLMPNAEVPKPRPSSSGSAPRT